MVREPNRPMSFSQVHIEYSHSSANQAMLSRAILQRHGRLLVADQPFQAAKGAKGAKTGSHSVDPPSGRGGLPSYPTRPSSRIGEVFRHQRNEAPRGGLWARSRVLGYARTNWPRPLLAKRDSPFLTVISRKMAA
jgi:hypothetical protein